MLRGRLPDELAQYPDPTLGVNLRDSLEDIKPGQAVKMENCFYDGGLRKRFGSSALTPASLGTFRCRGGTRVYPLTASAFRLIAYSTRISAISDAGAETVITPSLTSDQDVHFRTWSITDRTYVCNQSNTMGYVSSAQVWATVTGVNVPGSPTMVVPFVDRLFALQSDGVYASNPRVDTTWAPVSSSWSIYRPFASAGQPTAIHLHSTAGEHFDATASLLIFQPAAVTALRGTDFGSDVTLGSAPSTWDATLTTLAYNMGTNSPYSIVTVPALGTFWFTQDLNVAWLPFNSQTPKLIGDLLFSNRDDINGVNDVNTSALGQVVMIYHDRKLKLFLPIGSNVYPTVQYWLDLRQLQNIPTLVDKAEVAWSGPHEGQTVGRVWVESQGGDNNALYGGEGNSATGLFVYTLNDSTTYRDATGQSTAAVAMDYQTFYNPFSMPTYEKHMPEVRVDFSGRGENASIDLYDLHGSSVQGMSLYKNDGSAFTTQTYGGGYRYGDGNTYGASTGQNIGHVAVESQATSSMLGDAIAVRVQHSAQRFVLNSVIPQVKIRKQQQVA